MSSKFDVTLASVFDPKKLTFPKLASPKLDGIRCTIQDGVALSRNGKPIRNKFVQSIVGKKKFNGLDGELMVGDPTADDAFRVTTSGVMSEDGEPDFSFMIFDKFHASKPFIDRLDDAATVINNADNPYVSMVRHVAVNDMDELDAWEAEWVGVGYEGVMLRSLDGLYKQGRATVTSGDLLKVKRFSDAEARVIGYVEEKDKHGNPKNALGKFLCVTSDGVEFGVGGGFKRAERELFWQNPDAYIGQLLKYKYFAVGVKDAPRFPSFLGFRDENDMS